MRISLFKVQLKAVLELTFLSWKPAAAPQAPMPPSDWGSAAASPARCQALGARLGQLPPATPGEVLSPLDGHCQGQEGEARVRSYLLMPTCSFVVILVLFW